MLHALKSQARLANFRDSEFMIILNKIQNCLNYKYVHNLGHKNTSTSEHRT